VDGVGAAAHFSFPHAVVADGDGATLYISDGYAIRKMTVATRTVTTLAGVANQTGVIDGIGAAAGFGSPTDLVLDRHGNLFVSDYGTIRQVVVATGAVTTLAGAPGATGSQDGVGAAARFAGPTSIA